MKTWSRILLGFLVLFGVTLVFAHLKARGLPQVPKIDGISLDQEIRASWKNRPLVVYFWASWCGICKTYAPILEWNISHILPQGVVFLSIEEGQATDEERKEFMPTGSPSFLGNYHLLHDFGVNAFPTTVFVTRDREILFSDTGIITPLGFWVRSLLLEVL